MRSRSSWRASRSARLSCSAASSMAVIRALPLPNRATDHSVDLPGSSNSGGRGRWQEGRTDPFPIGAQRIPDRLAAQPRSAWSEARCVRPRVPVWMDGMPTFSAYDTTPLAYHLVGEGEPLICLPGGPMRASAYLGDLGGLSAVRQLVLLDLRGTGESAAPEDPSTYRCDRRGRRGGAARAPRPGPDRPAGPLGGREPGPAVRRPAPGAAAQPDPHHPFHPGRRHRGDRPGCARGRRAAQRRILVRRGPGRAGGAARRRALRRAVARRPPAHLRPLGRHGPGPRGRLRRPDQPRGARPLRRGRVRPRRPAPRPARAGRAGARPGR
ncbi:exported protein of unknown function [Streptomyces sp. KY75]|nr:exported protein of unknown function [Streptomyces sp. KY75]CAD5993596.1 exported protein of unknown function [Streptomyces sp. KY70]